MVRPATPLGVNTGALRKMATKDSVPTVGEIEEKLECWQSSMDELISEIGKLEQELEDLTEETEDWESDLIKKYDTPPSSEEDYDDTEKCGNETNDNSEFGVDADTSGGIPSPAVFEYSVDEYGLRFAVDESDSDSEDSNAEGYYDEMCTSGEQKKLRENIDKNEDAIDKKRKQVTENEQSIEELNQEAAELFRKYLEPIAAQDGEGRCKDPNYGTTLAKAWEFVATVLLSRLYRAKGLYAEHCGGRNDKGVDLLLRRRGTGELEAVVQVKRGRFFETGKGNSVVLCLVGSCVLHNVKEGVVFSNEEKDKLTKNTRELITQFEEQGYKIRCLFMDDIRSAVSDIGKEFEQTNVAMMDLLGLLNRLNID